MPRKKKSERTVTAPKPQRIALWKKLVFAAVACALFFATTEFVLWATGVPTLIEQEDPFRGFSGLVTVFERHGDVYRTRRSTLNSTFNDQSFLAQKPDNGLRIFCLGGSSSYGFPWGADAAFTAVLGEAIAASHPDLEVEAVNASGVSYAMHRLNIVADELIKYKPDVFIIYSGHNEFIEPAFFEALKRRSSVHTRVEYVLAHSRVYSGLRTLMGRGAKTRSGPDDDFSAEAQRDDTQAFSPQEKEAIVAEYAWRLKRLVRIAQENGVKVVLSTIPCNLSEWKPGASGGMTALSEGDRQAWSDAFGSAQLSVKAKEWEAAKADLERAARLAPGHAKTQFLLGKAYEALEQWDEARAAYQRACDADASPTRRVSGINDAIREVGPQEGVLLVDADRIFETLSNHGLVGFGLIKDYVHPNKKGHEIIAWHMWGAMEKAGWLGDEAAADEAVFKRVVAERRSRPQKGNATWFYNEGVSLNNQGQFGAAIKSYREALKISPDHVGVMNNLGRLLTKTGQAAEAVAVLERAVKLEPNRAEVHTNLGSALRVVKRPEEALAAHREALRLKPDYADAHYNLANTLLALGRAKKAVAHYQEALRLKPDNADAQSNLGNALLALGRFSEAVDHYEKSLRIEPGVADIYNSLGFALRRLGRNKEAVEQYRKALRLEPRSATTHNGLANALVRLGRLKEAVDHYRKTLELKPGLYQVHKGLASALLRLGRTDEAVTQYEKVLKLKPGLVRVRNRLAQILQGLGRFEKAITHYEEAVRLRPDYAAAHSNLARLRAVCSDPKYRDAPKALIGAKRACELSGWKHFGPLDTLASAYAAAGKFDEAVKWQTKAVELAPEGAKADLRSRLKLYAAKKPYRDTPKK